MNIFQKFQQANNKKQEAKEIKNRSYEYKETLTTSLGFYLCAKTLEEYSAKNIKLEAFDLVVNTSKRIKEMGITDIWYGKTTKTVYIQLQNPGLLMGVKGALMAGFLGYLRDKSIKDGSLLTDLIFKRIKLVEDPFYANLFYFEKIIDE